MTLTAARATRARSRGRALCATVVVASGLSLAAPARAQSAEVHLETDGSEMFVRTQLVTSVPVRSRYGTSMVRAPVYDPLCTGDACDKTLPPGRYYFGLSESDGAVVEAEDAVVVRSGDTVRGEYHSRLGLRLLGFTSLVVGPLIGAGLIVASMGSQAPCAEAPQQTSYPYGQPVQQESACPTYGVRRPGLLAAGVGVALAGAIAGFVLTAQKDSATFTVTPMNFSAPMAGRESGASAALPNGLQLTMRF